MPKISCKLIIISYFISTATALASITDPMVFSVEKDGKTSYILGAFHNISMEEFSEPIRTLLTDQEMIVIEHTAKMGFNTPIFKRGEKDPEWYSQLSPYAKAYLREKTPGVEDIGSLHQWAAFMAIHVSNFKGMDYQLTKLYTEAGKPLSSLEDNNEDEIAVAAKFLKDSCAEYNLTALIERQAFYYFNNLIPPEAINEEKVKAGYRAGLGLTHPIFFGVSLLKERNEMWIKNIETIHTTSVNPILFAVGVGHLVGKHGILKLLQDQGYTIQKANNDALFKLYYMPLSWMS